MARGRMQELRNMGQNEIAKAIFSLIFNLIFACYNGILGILQPSALLVVSALYYLLLGGMRLTLVLRKQRSHRHTDRQALAATGILLMVLSAVFHLIVFISIQQNTATAYGTIPMIAMATFTFVKITMAAVQARRFRHHPNGTVRALHAVRYAEVAVSLLTMQQSMLVSFGEGGTPAIGLNAFTGAGVCCFILLLGVFTFMRRKGEETMAKSKLVQAGKKVEKAVTGTYQKIENGVVSGYKAVENAVVGTYQKIEDKFVDQYLTRDGETVEEAKARLKKQTEEK